MAALSVAILSLSSFLPMLVYASPLFAGIFLIPVIDELGLKWGWMVWLTVSLLSAILLAEKESAAFYIFVGYYPMLKPILEKIKPKILCIAAKLAVFSVAIGLMYFILCYVLKLQAVLAEINSVSMAVNLVYYVIMVVMMLIYDVLLDKVRPIYLKRIKPKMKINLRMITFFLLMGFLILGRSDRAYAKTKAVTYFGNEWPVNFLNSEHAQAEADFARIKADGFNTVIYCVPWREIQPGSNGSFDEAALGKLDEMITRAGNCGLSVMLRLGYTWDYADHSSPMSRFNSLFSSRLARSAWLKYAERVYNLCSAHSNFAGAFLTWEDFWTSLASECSGYEEMDRKLMELLTQTQQVFPDLSMEVRLFDDMSGGKPYSHEKTYGCGNASYSSTIITAAMGYSDGSIISPGDAAAMSSALIGRVQAAGKPVFVDQFLYMETTPGYENIAKVSDVNAYLAGMADVFSSRTTGYGLWTYKDYADSIIYNPEFGMGTKGWSVSKASIENIGGNNKMHLNPGGSISQDLTGRGFGNSLSTKARLTVDSAESGKITVTAGRISKSVTVGPGTQTVDIDFGRQCKDSIRISSTVSCYIDDVKLYAHITEGNIYALDGTPGGYLSGIRVLNNNIK
ncbi:MAG: cellulase family glycosylhydrolase [Lachnospiraceae bacterium]|nr:cellulase family glycosylhydrolase [Lachnospiraceae bacterium]